MAVAKGLHKVSTVVSVKQRWRGRALHLRCHASKDLDRNGTVHRVFLNREGSHRLLGQSERSGFVTKAHIGQREITNEQIIFRLFFEKRFQFAARLPPTFLGGGMVASDFLRPA